MLIYIQTTKLFVYDVYWTTTLLYMETTCSAIMLSKYRIMNTVFATVKVKYKLKTL